MSDPRARDPAAFPPGRRRRAALLPARLAPPDRDALADLERRVAAVTKRRMRRLSRALRALAGRGASARQRAPRVAATLEILLAGAREALADLPAPVRRRALCGPDLRGFLSEAEIWTEVLRLAASGDRGVPSLFERISRTEHLVTLVPSGRVDAAFPARARALALERLAALVSDLGALLLGMHLVSGPSTRRLEVGLEFRASAEQGRPPGRIDLGTLAGPAGPLGLEGDEFPRRRARSPDRLSARLERGVLTLRSPGRPPIVLPAAGSPLASPHPALTRRRTVPGSPILVAPALRPGPRRLGVGRDLPGLGRRLARALRLARLAWPEAHDDVVARTAMVVPVREPGLVSYSLPARPRISFINVHRKSTLALADDLVHENAHHLLHDLQETTRLLAPGPDTEEVQAFASPWRGALRPLHGILHGTFTFLFRAELFIRILEARGRLPRVLGPLLGPGGAALVRREIGRELAMLRQALADLDTAAAHRLLAPDGRILAAALRSWHRRLQRRAATLRARRGRTATLRAHPRGRHDTTRRRRRRAGRPSRGGR